MEASRSFLRLITGKKALLNKTPALTKSMNIGIWVAVTIKSTLFKMFLYRIKIFQKIK